MFWRNRSQADDCELRRLFVILLALGAGRGDHRGVAELQIDAKRRLTTEFRALGANVIVAPLDANPSFWRGNVGASLTRRIAVGNAGKPVPAVAFLYVIGEVAKAGRFITNPQ